MIFCMAMDFTKLAKGTKSLIFHYNFEFSIWLYNFLWSQERLSHIQKDFDAHEWSQEIDIVLLIILKELAHVVSKSLTNHLWHKSYW